MDLIKKTKKHLSLFHSRHPKAGIVFKGFGYLFSERILKFIIGFFVHAFVARYLGPGDFGKLSYILKTVNVFYTFSLFGVDEIILNYLLKGKYDRGDILKTAFTLRIWASIIGLIILALFLIIFQTERDKFTMLTLLYGMQIIIQSLNLFELDFHSRLDFKPIFWASNASTIIASSLRVFGVFAQLGISFFVGTYIIGELVIKTILQWRLGFKAFRGRFIPSLGRDIVHASLPSFFSAFVVLLDQRISFFFIEKYLSFEQLGNYSVAVTLVDLWMFFPAAICSAFFPTIITSFNGNKEAYRIRIQVLADIIIWFAFIFSVSIFLFADYIIELLYGSRYLTAPDAIRFYALVTFPLFFNLVRTKWMALENNLKDWFWISLVSLILNIAGHIFLVPRFGFKGAIGSFLVAQLLSNLLSAIFLVSVRNAITIFLRSLWLPYRLIKQFIIINKS